MHIDNITSEKMTLDADGKSMQISIYEKNIEQLQQENKELNQKYLNAVADYETTMSELQELRKQLEKYKRLGFKHLNDKCNKLETQQKEFVEYLENEIYSIEPKGTGINYNCEYDSEEDYVMAMEEQSRLNILKEILSKYKSIIGEVKNER